MKTVGVTDPLRNAVLVGVDLGPNLSVTGSLATIFWLIAIQREGQEVGFWRFLKWGIRDASCARARHFGSTHWSADVIGK